MNYGIGICLVVSFVGTFAVQAVSGLEWVVEELWHSLWRIMQERSQMDYICIYSVRRKMKQFRVQSTVRCPDTGQQTK